MARRLRLMAVAGASAMALLGGQAQASGPGWPAPWYLDQFGGDAADMQRLYDGRLGIVMARSPRPQLFIAWRLLHGKAVGPAAGDALSTPCCNGPDIPFDGPPRGTDMWQEARKAVPGAPDLPDYLATERDQADYTVVLNCFPEAFETAAATLKDRAGRHGAGSPAVRAWLDGQDAVFKACGAAGVAMPAPLADGPGWLDADRAYQQAAMALYDGRYDEAAGRFAAIARDKASPWAGSGLYLTARSRVRLALTERVPARYDQAQAAIKALARAPAGTFGQGEARSLSRVLAYRVRPAELMAELDRELNQAALQPDVAVAFRDYEGLGSRAAADRPDAIDWMMTLSPAPDPATIEAATAAGEETLTAEARLEAQTRAAALAHARERWGASHDVAWLIAALSLAEPGARDAGPLVEDAAAVKENHPGWLTVQHHLVRLTMATSDASLTRARLDAVLAKDLSVSDRNVFTAARAQVAADAGDFVRLSLRKRLCPEVAAAPPCVRDRWFGGEDFQPSGIYDRKGSEGSVGFGEDARAVIDRLPLAERIALSRDGRLPANLRLDVALTSFVRAVQLQDDGAVDTLAKDLITLLPQLAADWRGIGAAKAGPDKRFAAFFVMAKIPGLRVDLVEYQRPEGPVAQFQQYWTDWIILPRGRPATGQAPAQLAAYQQGGFGVSETDPDSLTDLTCLGECGRGTAPLRLPDFAAAVKDRAAAERGYFFSTEHGYDQPPPAMPAGGIAVWDEMLAYARANPADPRIPEALYWLVHVGRYGGSHNSSGQRAFKLLHSAYAKSAWAGRTPYYYD